MILSLRARLLLGLVALVLLGILVADAATYASLKTFLYQRVDQQLRDSDQQALNALNATYETHGGGPGGPHHDGNNGAPNLPQGTYAAVLGPDGKVVTELVAVFPGQAPTAARPGRRPYPRWRGRTGSPITSS